MFEFIIKIKNWYDRRVDERLDYLERISELEEKKFNAEVKKLEAEAELVNQQAKTIHAGIKR